MPVLDDPHSKLFLLVTAEAQVYLTSILSLDFGHKDHPQAVSVNLEAQQMQRFMEEQ